MQTLSKRQMTLGVAGGGGEEGAKRVSYLITNMSVMALCCLRNWPGRLRIVGSDPLKSK